MREAIQKFLDVLERPGEDPDRRFEALACALDGLLIAYHKTVEPVFDEIDYPEPEEKDRDRIKKSIEHAFPEFGWYWCTTPTSPNIKEEILVSDAVDDLVDIALDMHEIIWRLDKTSEDDAIWHFRFSFRTHWGLHLLSLRYYIHWKQHYS